MIEHRGIVKEISDKSLRVEILSKSACAACHAKGLCGASDEKIKEIDVVKPSDKSFSVGEQVNVCLSASMGMRAVVICYVAPLIILLFLLLSLSNVLMSELYAALIALGGVAVYYFFVYLFKNRIKKEYIFIVNKI